MFRIVTPDRFVTSPWKNGGGVTHEILRREAFGKWLWRLSIAEVEVDGPFSRFERLSRILTVIEGNGVDLHTPDGVLQARALKPVRFSGDLPVESRMVDGPIRDLNVIYDPEQVEAEVTIIECAGSFAAGPGETGFLNLRGRVTAQSDDVPVGAFAFGTDGEIDLAPGAAGLLVMLRERR